VFAHTVEKPQNALAASEPIKQQAAAKKLKKNYSNVIKNGN